MEDNNRGYREELDQYTPETQKPKGLIDPLIHYAYEKSIEEKIYIVLYVLNPDYTEEELDRIYHNIYSVCIGRSETYEDIKLKLNSSIGVDVYKSIVITETLQTETSTSNTKYYLMPFNECISVYDFVKRVQPLMPRDDFDIDFFIEEGMEEVDYKEAFKEDHPTYLDEDQLRYRHIMMNDPNWKYRIPEGTKLLFDLPGKDV